MWVSVLAMLLIIYHLLLYLKRSYITNCANYSTANVKSLIAFVTQSSTVKDYFKQLKNLHTHLSHLLYLTGVETENLTLWLNKQPAYILEAFSVHQQLVLPR